MWSGKCHYRQALTRIFQKLHEIPAVIREVQGTEQAPEMLEAEREAEQAKIDEGALKA